jgi:ribonucleoside-diphosphate reductase beta chain
MHVQFACELYRLLKNKLSSDIVYSIVDSGVRVAKLFMTDALPVRLIGMNGDSMCEYLEYVADRLVVELGYPKYYHSPNPFAFMETIGMMGKTNFFESRPTEYQSAHSESKKAFETLSDDF